MRHFTLISFGFGKTDRRLLRSIAKGVVYIMSNLDSMRASLGEINAATDDIANDIDALVKRLDEANLNDDGLSTDESDEIAGALENLSGRLRGIAAEYPKEDESSEEAPEVTPLHEQPVKVDGIDNAKPASDGMTDLSKDGEPGREAILDNDKVNAEFPGGFSGANPMVDPGRAGASVPEGDPQEIRERGVPEAPEGETPEEDMESPTNL